MATGFEAIATVTVGSGGAASIEFTSIAADWTDLVILASTRSDRASVAEDIKISFNGSATSQTLRNINGNGASASSANDTLIYAWSVGNSATASTFGNWQAYIPNYAGSTNKSVSIDAIGENNATTAYSALAAGLWSNTAAITSITLAPYTGPNWLQYSTATLYGIKNS